MKGFLDTSVLVATFYGDHEHHQPSKDLFLRYKKKEVGCAAHSLAEVYATLTGMPGKDRVSPDSALLFLADVRDRLTLIALTPEEYFETLEINSRVGVTGGGVYDALLAQCALKAKADVIYTWNIKHFKRLMPAVASRVTTP